MSTSRALGAEKPATKRPRSYMEGPRNGKASCKTSKKCIWQLQPTRRGRGGARARARAPPPSRKGALCACGILSIYLSNMRQIPAAACVARFWAQPPKSVLSIFCAIVCCLILSCRSFSDLSVLSGLWLTTYLLHLLYLVYLPIYLLIYLSFSPSMYPSVTCLSFQLGIYRYTCFYTHV